MKTVAPTIDTAEGRRWHLSARCAQAALLLETITMHHDEVELEVADAFVALAAACDRVGELSRKYDWCNEAGE